MNEDFKITMRDVRAANMCSGGARMFFKQHGLNWSQFVKEGLSASKFAETGDALGLKLVEITKQKKALNGRVK
jgi:hypothetical protein